MFLRAKGYSLAEALGASVASIEENEPGSYSGPIVASGQALAVLVGLAAAFAGLAALAWRRRDVE